MVGFVTQGSRYAFLGGTTLAAGPVNERQIEVGRGWVGTELECPLQIGQASR